MSTPLARSPRPVPRSGAAAHGRSTTSLTDVEASAEPVRRDDQRRPARIADRVTAVFGSRAFVVAQGTLLVLWSGCNGWAATRWFAGSDVDPLPVILLNLLFCTQAAYAVPLILLSRNRTAERNGVEAERDADVLVHALAELLGDEPVRAPTSVTDRPTRKIYVRCAPGRPPGRGRSTRPAPPAFRPCPTG